MSDFDKARYEAAEQLKNRKFPTLPYGMESIAKDEIACLRNGTWYGFVAGAEWAKQYLEENDRKSVQESARRILDAAKQISDESPSYKELEEKNNMLRESLKLAVEWIGKETDCQRLSFRHVRPCSRCDILNKIKATMGEG